MGVIESEEAAKRLARVIVSDIEIYNKEKFQAGADLTAAIEEGRALFRSRVAPALHPLFTAVVEDRLEDRRAKKAAAKAAATTAAAAAPASAVPAVESAPVRTAPVAPHPPAPRPAPVVLAAPSRTPTPAPQPPPEVVIEAPAPAPVAAAAPAPAVAAPAARTAASGRPGAIDNEEAAARLARVIVSDIQLYNAKKIANGENLNREIDEGRSLFKSRVNPELTPIFETTLASKGLGENRQSAPATSALAAAASAPAPAHFPAPAVARAPIPVIESPAHAPIEPAPPSRRPASAPAPIARAPFPAVKTPMATPPRPGASAVRRPTPAPQSVPMSVAEVGSSRYPGASAVPPGERAARTASGAYAIQDHAGHAPGRYDQASYDAETASDELTPAMSSQLTPLPVALGASTSPRTPPPAPQSPPRSATPTPPPTPQPRRARPPSSAEIPIVVDSTPYPEDAPSANASLLSQDVRDDVLDALPPPASFPAPRRLPTPASFPLTLPTPPLPVPMADPAAMSAQNAQMNAQVAANTEVPSLRGGMSKTRLVLTVATLAGAGAVFYYFLLR